MKPYLLLFTLLSFGVSAQTTDSIRTELTVEDHAVSASDTKRFLRYITRADIEEKTLIKLGVWPATNNGTGASRPLLGLGLNAETTIEQKLTPAISVYVGANYAYRYVRYERVLFNQPVNGVTNSIDKLREFTLSTKAGVRYYYAMAKKVREGKVANNFSGNYVAIQAERYLTNDVRRRWYDLVTGDSREGSTTGADAQPIISIFWGFQRRLGRLGYVDLSAGPSYRLADQQTIQTNSVFREVPTGRSLSLQINALIGLGW